MIVSAIFLIAGSAFFTMQSDLFKGSIDRAQTEPEEEANDEETNIPWWCISDEDWDELYGGGDDEEDEEEGGDDGEVPTDAAGISTPPGSDNGSDSSREQPERSGNDDSEGDYDRSSSSDRGGSGNNSSPADIGITTLIISDTLIDLTTMLSIDWVSILSNYERSDYGNTVRGNTPPSRGGSGGDDMPIPTPPVDPPEDEEITIKMTVECSCDATGIEVLMPNNETWGYPCPEIGESDFWDETFCLDEDCSSEGLVEVTITKPEQCDPDLKENEEIWEWFWCDCDDEEVYSEILGEWIECPEITNKGEIETIEVSENEFIYIEGKMTKECSEEWQCPEDFDLYWDKIYEDCFSEENIENVCNDDKTGIIEEACDVLLGGIEEVSDVLFGGLDCDSVVND